MTIGQFGLDLGILEIHFIENPGMAFGFELPFTGGKIVLGLLRIAAIVAITLYVKKLLTKQAPIGLIIAISCVLAGAIGNVIDGAFYGMIFSESSYSEVAQFLPAEVDYSEFMKGQVVDMLEFTFNLPEWFPFWGGKQAFPFIFNIADAAISIGIVVILVWYRSFFKSQTTLQTVSGTDQNSHEEE